MMDRAGHPMHEAQELDPPPFWWTRRLIALGAIVLFVLAFGHYRWLKQTRAALDADIRAIQARGEPIWADDFNTARIANEDNAAYYIQQCFPLFIEKLSSPAASTMQYPDYPPFSAEWYDVAKQSIDAHPKVFELARKARQQSKVDWGLVFQTPTINILLPALNPSRHLANLLGDAALYAHFARGDDAEAMELIRDVLAEADAVDQQPIVVSHLVATGIRALAMNRLQTILADINLGNGRSTPATRQQMQELIQTMRAIAAQNGMERAYLGERMGQLDLALWSTRNSSILKPLFLNDTRLMMSHTTDQLTASRETNYPAAMAALPAPPFPGRDPNYRRVLSEAFLPSLSRFIMTDFRARMEASLTAANLAVQLYRADHDGAFPPDLQALVPKYLPEVPIDPLSPTGARLGYRTFTTHDGKPRPMVYSVGEDGEDSTVQRQATPAPGPSFEWAQSRSAAEDQWRDLSRFAPPPPATAPAE